MKYGRKRYEEYLKAKLDEALFDLRICQDCVQDQDQRIKILEKEKMELHFDLYEANRHLKEKIRTKNVSYTHMEKGRYKEMERNAHVWELVSRIYHERILSGDDDHDFDLACKQLEDEWYKVHGDLSIWGAAKEIYNEQKSEFEEGI